MIRLALLLILAAGPLCAETARLTRPTPPVPTPPLVLPESGGCGCYRCGRNVCAYGDETKTPLWDWTVEERLEE